MIFSTMTRMRHGTTALALLLALTSPALAQPSCGFEDDLLALAGTVLDKREELPPLQAKRFGAQAAYLTLSYSEMENADVERMLDHLVKTRVAGAEELRFAWHIATHGITATLARLGPNSLNEEMAAAHISSIRALLLNGNWEETMAAIAALPAAEQVRIFSPVITAIIDQPDPLKGEMGEVAARHGLPLLVAGFAAAATDYRGWERHIEGMDAAEREEVANFWQWLPPMVGNPMLVRGQRDLEAEMRRNRAVLSQVGIAAALQPDREFLNTWFNYTGDFERSRTVAEALIAQYDTGALRPSVPLDAGWLATYRALLAAGVAPAELLSVLNGSSFGLGRYGRGTGAEATDWMLAVEALTPYLRNETQEPPKSPKTFSNGFADWDHWVVLATQVKADPNDAAFPGNEADLPVVAELLFAAQEMEGLAGMLGAAPVSLASVSMANDLSVRLDRLCDAHLAHKAEAVMLAGQPIYKFFSPLD